MTFSTVWSPGTSYINSDKMSSIIARKPLAPVFLSRAFCATASNALSSKSSSTLSSKNSFLYCFNTEFLGSFNILIKDSLSSPLRDRFGITCKLNYYTTEELKTIVKRSARVLNLNIDDKAAEIIAKRSRRTPRIANRLLKRVSDFALVKGLDVINESITNESLKRLNVDESGLDKTDIEYLESLINKFNGGPVGIESIAASIGEEQTTIEDVIEPFLLQEGFIKRTIRGRQVTDKTYEYLGIEK
mgnify:FL=1